MAYKRDGGGGSACECCRCTARGAHSCDALLWHGSTVWAGKQQASHASSFDLPENGHPSSPCHADCEFNSPTLALFTSSLFLAAMCAALPAGYITRRWGRKASMLLGGLW